MFSKMIRIFSRLVELKFVCKYYYRASFEFLSLNLKIISTAGIHKEFKDLFWV